MDGDSYTIVKRQNGKGYYVNVTKWSESAGHYTGTTRATTERFPTRGAAARWIEQVEEDDFEDGEMYPGCSS